MKSARADFFYAVACLLMDAASTVATFNMMAVVPVVHKLSLSKRTTKRFRYIAPNKLLVAVICTAK